MTFADALKDACLKLELSQTALAEAVHVSFTSINRYEKGHHIGNAEPVLSLAGYANIVFSMDVVKVLPKGRGISKFLIAALLQTERFKQHCLAMLTEQQYSI